MDPVNKLKLGSDKITRTRVSAVIINNNKLLLVIGNSGFYKDFYFTPGGKVENMETEIDALKRELHEELSVGVKSVEKYFEYVAKNWDGGLQKVVCYLVAVEVEEIKLNGEISEMYWYSRDDFEKGKVKVSESMAMFLVPKLISDGLI